MSDMPQDEVEEGVFIPERYVKKVKDDLLDMTWSKAILPSPLTLRPASAPKPWTLDDIPEHQAAMRFLGYDLGYWLYVKMVLQKTNMLEELEHGYKEFKEKK